MVFLVALCPVEAFHHERRMYTVEVADGEMSAQESILRAVVVVHIVGSVVSSVAVGTVFYFIIFQFVAGDFRSRSPVYHGYVERWIALALLPIVGYSVTVRVGRFAAIGVFSPCIRLAVPEAGSVRAFYYHLALAVAVDVVSHNHVVLSCADVDVRSHIYCP